MFPFSFNFDVGCDFFGNKTCFLDFKPFDIRFLHLSTDKSTGKSYLSGRCNNNNSSLLGLLDEVSQLRNKRRAIKTTCPEQHMYHSDHTDN